MRLRIEAVAIAAVIAIGVVGCGGSSGSQHTSSGPSKTVTKVVQPAGGPGTYSYTDPSGTVFQVTIPAPSGYPLATELASERHQLGDTAPLAYAAVTIDNTRGSTPVQIDVTSDVLQVVTNTGQQVTFQTGDRQTACLADNALPACSSSSNPTLYNQDVNLYNKLVSGVKSVLPGAKVQSVLATTTPSFTISRVFFLQAPSSRPMPVQMTKGGPASSSGTTSSAGTTTSSGGSQK
jgi:hypothetical protein